MSNLLNDSLFLSKKHPRDCLLAIKEEAIQLKKELSLLPNDIRYALSIEEFKKKVKDFHLKEILGTFKRSEAKIVASLKDAITKEVESFKLLNKINI